MTTAKAFIDDKTERQWLIAFHLAFCFLWSQGIIPVPMVRSEMWMVN